MYMYILYVYNYLQVYVDDMKYRCMFDDFDDHWWILMMHVDCTVYDSIASLVSFAFANPNPRSSVEMKVFSPRYIQALQQVVNVNASRHHLCCPYCLARTTIQLANDKCRRMASYDVIRGQEIEGTCPSCNGPFGHSEMRQIHAKSCVKPEWG